ncbi:unnamed protein product [Timema podura]|uniref:Uncharacterized protein n=1 Tax=Timema podura TaxID=61482 RepID=A0ABN7NZ37_TIMPD|nr:unnamed protein product [Timema podura]
MASRNVSAHSCNTDQLGNEALKTAYKLTRTYRVLESRYESAPAFALKEIETQFRKNHPQCTRPESNLDLPVIGSLVQHESSALDHAATEYLTCSFLTYCMYQHTNNRPHDLVLSATGKKTRSPGFDSRLVP